MDIVRYKPLDPLTKIYDYSTTNVTRRRDVIINGEEWEYVYFSGRLEWVQLKYENIFNVKQQHRLYHFDKETKQISHGVEYGSYIDEGGVIYDGVYKKFLVDQYGNNIGNIKIEYWIDGLQDGLWTVWHENGQKESERTYKDGELISSKCWDEDGNEMECPPQKK